MLIQCLDDEPRVELLLRRILKPLGHELRFDSSVQTFKEGVGASTPDLVMLDLGLGRESGIDVIHWLAQSDLRLPLVLLSGRGDSLLDTARRVAEGHGVWVPGIVNKGRLARELPAVLDEAFHSMPTAVAAPPPSVQDGPARPKQSANRRRLEPAALQSAISAGAVLPYLQPIVATDTGALRGAEVLARLRLPNGKILNAGHFIPLAESHDLILPLTEALFQRLLDQKQLLVGPALDFLAVNLSAASLNQQHTVDLVQALVTGLEDHCRVRTEITETAATQSAQQMQSLTARIKLTGASLAIDDFGTGYSSLRALAELPFETLKIDLSFVDEMFDSPKSLRLLRAIIGFGRSLDLQLVAEGVETEAQRQLLVTEGVDLAQGYLFGKPMSIEAFSEAFTNRSGTITPALNHPKRFSRAS